MVVIAEYIWIGGNNELRSKTKVMENFNGLYVPENYPNWNYDGSSTNQANGHKSEVIIKPVAVYNCPFRKKSSDFNSLHDNIYYSVLILCDTYTPDDKPLPNNHRCWANNIFNKNLGEAPWFGIEQEFFLIDPSTKLPLGFPVNGNPNPQGQYYCSVGASNAFGRKILEEHLSACIIAGITISGINAEVAPGQWEYQVGPCTGIKAGDQLLISRYILQRVAEKYNVDIELHPKPLSGDWNGSGCHTNYSTKGTREGLGSKTGLDIIYEHMLKLENKHIDHMKIYGEYNNLRMTGIHETASYDKFTYGIGSRNTSIRIGNDVFKEKCGYYEDRRPSSNMNPYLVTAKIFETTI